MQPASGASTVVLGTARAPIAAFIVVGTPRTTKKWVEPTGNIGGRVVLYENEIEPEAPEVSTLAVEEIELGGVSLRVLESCHSIWIFEPGRMRFRRVPRGTRIDMPSPESEWTPYFRLEVEPSSGAFAVGLNQDDTRVLRSWLHIEPCRHCAGDQTGEVSLDAIRRQIDSRPRSG